jgi:rhodanese-related sulfurtransferase
MASAHTDISVSEAHAMIVADETLIVLDVREYSEFCDSYLHIEDSVMLPWITEVLQARFTELPTDVDIIVVCTTGMRSNMAANFLDQQGFTSVYDMLGGLAAWTEERESCDGEPVLTLSKRASGVEINWTPINGIQDYDLLRGSIDGMADAGTHIDLGTTTCLSDDSAFTYFTDPGWPFTPYFYLARQKDGSYGRSSSGKQRRSASLSCD